MTKKASKAKYNKILAEISTGISVRKACEKYGVPESTFRLSVDPAQYARAREACVEALADEIMDISDDGRNDWMEKHGQEDTGWLLNGENVQRSKLRVDARKWLLSKIAPKKYGDKVAMEHTSPDGSMGVLHCEQKALQAREELKRIQEERELVRADDL